MSLNEGRLRAMLDPNSLADWNLNEEDRAAIRWALDLIIQQTDELRERRHEYLLLWRRANARTERLREAMKSLQSAIEDS